MSAHVSTVSCGRGRSLAPVLGLLVTLALAGCGARVQRTSTAGAAPAKPQAAGASNTAALACGQRAATPNGLLADFESGRADAWFSYADGTPGGVLEQRVEPSAESHALHVTARGFHGWGAGVGLAFGGWTPAARGCELDASAYAGIRFRARGAGTLRIAVATTPLAPRAEGGECDQGEACYDWPGTDVELTGTWTTFELPFCSLAPAGWGRTGTRVDARRLYQIHFRFAPNQPHDLWLDDVSLFARSGAKSGADCGPVCPLAAVPRGAVVEPARISAQYVAAGLSVHTFEQPTRTCGTLTRRYLEYVPKRPRAKATPLVIALHGFGSSAEGFRDFQTHARFETLAERDGFVVVYANAAPSAATDARYPNSGAWFSSPEPDAEVDDFDYLRAVHDELAARGDIAEGSPTFLVGQSNGGGMVLEAARLHPERYAGFAAFMPYDGQTPVLPTPDNRSRLTRALFVYSLGDPGLPGGYGTKLRTLADAWSRALGMPAAVLAAPVRKVLADRVNEGASYAGTDGAALRTRASRGEQLDFASGRAAARYIVFDHAGHFWPNGAGDSVPGVLEKWGFRNQDVDGADAAWEFFESALGTP